MANRKVQGDVGGKAWAPKGMGGGNEVNTEWLCGCGAWNGTNLDHCGRCERTRREGELIVPETPSAAAVKDVREGRLPKVVSE